MSHRISGLRPRDPGVRSFAGMASSYRRANLSQTCRSGPCPRTADNVRSSMSPRISGLRPRDPGGRSFAGMASSYKQANPSQTCRSGPCPRTADNVRSSMSHRISGLRPRDPGVRSFAGMASSYRRANPSQTCRGGPCPRTADNVRARTPPTAPRPAPAGHRFGSPARSCSHPGSSSALAGHHRYVALAATSRGAGPVGG